MEFTYINVCSFYYGTGEAISSTKSNSSSSPKSSQSGELEFEFWIPVSISDTYTGEKTFRKFLIHSDP